MTGGPSVSEKVRPGGAVRSGKTGVTSGQWIEIIIVIGIPPAKAGIGKGNA